MSPVVQFILLVVVAGTIALGIYLWMIKKYYWTKDQKERRRKEGKDGWLS